MPLHVAPLRETIRPRRRRLGRRGYQQGRSCLANSPHSTCQPSFAYQVRVSVLTTPVSFILDGGAAMPFGLCNAPATFQRLMDSVFAGLQWSSCLVYVDDVVIPGKAFEDHLHNFESLLSRLRAANLKLQPSKCARRSDFWAM